MRKVHIDFHTSPIIENVGRDFDEVEFFEILSLTHLDSLQIFSKDHHGMSYYDTKVGTRHPHLKFDLLRKQIEVARRLGVKVYIYYSVCWDENIAENHPEWLQVDRDRKPRRPVPSKGWATLCLNSPYAKELLLPQTQEILKNYDLDGFFYDIVLVMDGECFCQYCMAKMKEAGLEPESEKAQKDFSDQTIFGFIKKVSNFIRTIKPKAEIIYNNQVKIGNRKILPYITNLEIEAVPTDQWGYHYFPLYSRYIRTLDIPYTGITARFHSVWSDFGGLKESTALGWEISTILANGAACYIGDHAYPGYRLARSVYETIGEVYKDVKEKEKWCMGVQPLVQIGVLADTEMGSKGKGEPPPELWGASKILIEIHCQFNIIDYDEDFNKYSLIFLADNRMLGEKEIEKLKAFIKNGGKVLATHLATFDESSKQFLFDELGIEYDGHSPFSLDYLRLTQKISKGIRPFDYAVYDRFIQCRLKEGTEVLAQTVHPYFERTPEHYTSHAYSPPNKLSQYPAITKNKNCIYIAAPIFKSYYENGNIVYRRIIDNCIDLLLPQRLIVTDAPPIVEVTILKQEQRKIIHLVNYIPQKRGTHSEVIGEVPCLYNINIEVLCPESPSSVYLVPSMGKLKVTRKGDYISFTVPHLHIHQMVVVE